MKDIKSLREKINEIDDKMQQLFKERMHASSDIGNYKAANSLPVEAPEREKEILERTAEGSEEEIKPYMLNFQQHMFDLSKRYQKRLINSQVSFLSPDRDSSPFTDAAFAVSKLASEDQSPDTVNATLGTLYDEDGRLAIIPCVYEAYRQQDDRRKARYASQIQGNDDYLELVWQWVNRLDNIHVPHGIIAAPGGTGAINMAVANCLDTHETMLIPDIGWGSYRTMASVLRLNTETYTLGKDISDLQEKARRIMRNQRKLLVIINDPCHNPTGLSYGVEIWKQLIEFFNELSQEGPVVVINDIAYFDYSADWQNATAYMSAFSDISDNVSVMIAFSCSKSLTAYGMRLGALITLASDQQKITEIQSCFTRYARATWSNVNNGFMDCFVTVLGEKKERYLTEKQNFIDMLKNRSQLFLKQAEECGLPTYPYKEGFFITVPVADSETLSRLHSKLIDNHIYTVKILQGHQDRHLFIKHETY